MRKVTKKQEEEKERRKTSKARVKGKMTYDLTGAFVCNARDNLEVSDLLEYDNGRVSDLENNALNKWLHCDEKIAAILRCKYKAVLS